MASTFEMCTNCGCNEEAVEVYKCYECNGTNCYVCSNRGIFSTKCPNCDSGGQKLGEIYNH
jgi:hypothetical protein